MLIHILNDKKKKSKEKLTVFSPAGLLSSVFITENWTESGSRRDAV